MTQPYWTSDDGRHALFHGDAAEVLRQMEPESVQLVVTSPPYFGLRQYAADERQIGREETFAEYVDRLVEAFREVRRVLHRTGLVFLNLGDSYAGSWGNQGRKQSRGTQRPINGPQIQEYRGGRYPERKKTGSLLRATGLKNKELIGIPWRVAFALQADGWWLRQDLIWHKSNAMPESVRDRCTKSHEYIFMLSRSELYYFNHDSNQEPATRGPAGSSFASGKTSIHQCGRASTAKRVDHKTRNRRSVWSIATARYQGAHYATFPPALVEPCVQIGSRPDDVVLDPFCGSNTTGAVAQRLGRRSIGIDLSGQYLHDNAIPRMTGESRQTGPPQAWLDFGL